MHDLTTPDGRNEAFKRMGSAYQAAGTRHYRLTDGSTDGVRVIDVKTGSGLEYSVVPDRGLDISLASYKGLNLTYLARNGEVHPAFYESRGEKWLRTFFAGMLTTCGATYLGPPCVDQGEELGLHGRHSGTPARGVCDLSDFRAGTLRVTGSIEDCTVFGDKIILRRAISSEIGRSAIVVEDVVENIGSRDAPLMLLYHVNFGYPLLCGDTQIFVSAGKPEAYDEYSRQYIHEANSFREPGGENTEKNYWYTFEGRKTACAMAVNRHLAGGIAVYVRFDPQTLPYLTQWKLEDEADYVLALEPANVPCLSRSELRQKDALPVLRAHERRTLKVEIGVIEGTGAIEQFINEVSEA